MVPIELLDPCALHTMMVIPIRSFAFAKLRLGEALNDEARRELARTLAERVADAAGRLSILVVSSDPEVVSWAEARMCFVIDDPGSLDGAASAGRTWAAAHEMQRVVIAHADLAFADDFERILRPGPAEHAVIVPDRFDDGTPVISLPTSGAFTFSYGLGSFDRHCANARAAGFAVEILRDHAFGFDVDHPVDLETMHNFRQT